jgi:hypothetical protein
VFVSGNTGPAVLERSFAGDWDFNLSKVYLAKLNNWRKKIDITRHQEDQAINRDSGQVVCKSGLN